MDISSEVENVDNRIDVLSDARAIRFIRSLQLLFLLSCALLVLETVWVQADGQSYANHLLYMNVTVGSVSFALVIVTGIIVYKDVLSLSKSKVVIPQRVNLFFRLAIVDYVLRLLMLFFFMASVVYLLLDQCAWIYSSVEVLDFCKWSLFNASVANQFLILFSLLPKETIESTLKSLRLYEYVVVQRNVRIRQGAELPGVAYATVFILFFFPTEICLLLSLFASTGVIGGTWCSSSNLIVCLEAIHSNTCDPWYTGCSASKGYGKQTLSIAGSAITVFNMLLYILGVYITNKKLLYLPYKEYKSIHMQLGYQILSRLSFTLLAILNFILLALVGYDNCPASFTTAVGFAPLTFALTMCVVMSLWMQTPIKSLVSHDGSGKIDWGPLHDSHALKNTCSYPCILKGFIFSYIVYDIEELPEEEHVFCVETFLEEYCMTDHVVIWNKKIDSKCLFAWNESSGQIIMAFRGTASGRNVVSDLKFWREVHPPKRGNYFLGTCPLVHAGFREFFYDSGIKTKCFDIINRLLHSDQKKTKRWDIFVCGHSLGGAAAKLAAYETSVWIESHHPHVKYTLKCYCYGSPRAGNRAFVKSYNQQCPDTWNMMHLGDIVTKGGFYGIYQREGRSLFLSNSGNILEPSYIERVTLRGIKASIQRHLMPSYGCSIVGMVKHDTWDSPGLQRIYFAITNSQAYRDISIKFSSLPKLTASAVSDETQDLDLATGLSVEFVHRTHTVETTPPGRIYRFLKVALHQYF